MSNNSTWKNLHWREVQNMNEEERGKLLEKLDDETKKRLIAEKITWYLGSKGVDSK